MIFTHKDGEVQVAMKDWIEKMLEEFPIQEKSDVFAANCNKSLTKQEKSGQFVIVDQA